jgi:hypothetical protein
VGDDDDDDGDGLLKRKTPTFESTYHSNTCPVASVFFGHHPTSFPLIQS